MSDDPERLSQSADIDDPLRVALSDAREDGPSPRELAHMAAALGPIFGGGAAGGGAAGGGAGGGATGGAASGIGLGKAVLGAAAVGAVVAGIVAYATLGEPDPLGTPTSSSGVSVPGVTVEDEEAATGDGDGTPAEETPAVEAIELMPEPLATDAAPDDETRAERRRQRELRRAAAAAGDDDEPAATTTGASASTDTADATSSTGVVVDEADDGPSETQLLEQARAALRGAPGRALALTREHAQRFPRSPLAQEREVIAIEALVRVGNREAARARAERFRARYPSSLHNRHLDTLLQ